MKTFILLVTLFISQLISAQPEKINQTDSAGKRHGKWQRYLDQQWKTVNDSSQAVYFRYTFYDHGINLHPMGPCGKKGWNLVTPEITNKQAGIQMLDGEYKWYDTKGRLVSAHVFSKGEYVSYKEYYRSGKLHSFFDYTRRFNNQPHSWYSCEYDKAERVKYEGYVKKDEKGHWPLMRG
jgi:hypothetical protein